MNNLSIRRIKYIFVFVLVFVMSLVFGVFSVSKANEKTLSDLNLQIDVNSEVYIEGDGGVNGIFFTATMSQEDYYWLISQVGENKPYAKFETGLIIAPSYYNDEVAIDGSSLFGTDATYDFAIYKNGAYEYSGDKIRVININANKWVDEGDTYTYKGGIVDIRETNETEEFFALSYIKLTDVNEVSSFVFSSSVTDSVVASASRAVKAGTLSAEQLSWVMDNWLDDEGVSDAVEYLVDVKDRLIYDISDAIYDSSARKLIESYGKENLDFELTDVNGKVKTDRVLNVTEDDSLKLWTVKVFIGDKVLYIGKADIYNSSKSAVWNVMSQTSGIENGLLIRNEDSRIDNKMQAVKYTGSVTTEDNKPVIKATVSIESFYFSVLPVHSKGYYETYQDGDYSFSYNWKYTTTATYNSGGQAFYFLNGKSWNGSNKMDTWYSNNLTLKQIVENWEGFTDFETREWGKRYLTGMFCTYNLLNSSGNIDIFVNFSLIDNDAINTLVDLNEVEDKTSVSLAEVVNEGIYSNLINNYPSANWYLVDAVKGTETLIEDRTDFDISAFAEKSYVLTVKDSGAVVFEGDFDIYDSTENLVWNIVSSDTVGCVKVYQFINANQGDGLLDNAVSVTDDGFFKATGNEFYYYNNAGTTVSPLEYMSVTVLPLHSRSYYQQYYGEGIIIRMEVIKEGLLDYSIVQFKDENYHNYWGTKYAEVTIKLDDILDNWISYTGTGMSTNTDAWTLMTRASGNVENQNQQFIISLGNITITQLAESETGIESLKGKQVTVIGDSISTWNKNPTGATYPNVSNNSTNNQNITKSDTWWQQVIDNYGMELVVNKATSGATAGHGVLMNGNPTSNSKLNVCSSDKSLSLQGVNPDIVLLYIGMNDMCRGSTIIKDGDDITDNAFYDMIPGLYTSYNEGYSSTSDYGMALSRSLYLDTYARAYAYIIYSIKTNYPSAQIICLNLPEKLSTASAYNEVINTVAGHYNVPVVDIYSAFKAAGGSYADSTYCYDSLHPNANGFDIMSNAVIAKMNELFAV